MPTENLHRAAAQLAKAVRREVGRPHGRGRQAKGEPGPSYGDAWARAISGWRDSVRLAQNVGINASPTRAGRAADVQYTVFPGSGRGVQ